MWFIKLIPEVACDRKIWSISSKKFSAFSDCNSRWPMWCALGKCVTVKGRYLKGQRASISGRRTCEVLGEFTPTWGYYSSFCLQRGSKCSSIFKAREWLIAKKQRTVMRSLLISLSNLIPSNSCKKACQNLSILERTHSLTGSFSSAFLAVQVKMPDK